MCIADNIFINTPHRTRAMFFRYQFVTLLQPGFLRGLLTQKNLFNLVISHEMDTKTYIKVPLWVKCWSRCLSLTGKAIRTIYQCECWNVQIFVRKVSMKQSLPILEKVTNDVMSSATCAKVLRLNISSLHPNVQVEVALTIIRRVVDKEYLDFPLSS